MTHSTDGILSRIGLLNLDLESILRTSQFFNVDAVSIDRGQFYFDISNSYFRGLLDYYSRDGRLIITQHLWCNDEDLTTGEVDTLSRQFKMLVSKYRGLSLDFQIPQDIFDQGLSTLDSERYDFRRFLGSYTIDERDNNLTF